MKVSNVHERFLRLPLADAWWLVTSLGSEEDLLWPRHWPRIHFVGPLAMGTVGGHGPIGYVVERCIAQECIRFRFIRPWGFDGYHEFRLLSRADGVVLRHGLHMRARGLALLYWALVLRPLHDALIEDLLDRASSYASGHPFETPWTLWVYLLRRLFGRTRWRRAPAQRREPLETSR